MKIWRKLLCTAMLVFGCSTAFAKGKIFKHHAKRCDRKGVFFWKGKKPTYVKFWASWCPICLSSLEEIDELSKEKKTLKWLPLSFPERKEKRMEQTLKRGINL